MLHFLYSELQNNNNDDTSTEPVAISATNLSYQLSVKDKGTYENTSLPTSPVQASYPAVETKAWSDIGQYTDIAGPLPGFLRNEEMLQVPTVDDEVIAAAMNDSFEKPPEDLDVKPTSKPRLSGPSDDYVDPQDAKNEAAALKGHQKVARMMSKGNQKAETKPLHKIVSDSEGDYTTVSDALPKGTFEVVDKHRLSVGDGRSRTSSDVSPMLSSRSADSGKYSNSSPSAQKKSQSLNRRNKRPQHIDVKQTKSQPMKRRSTTQQKEFVSFDPQTGFKLAAKRTNSDGTPKVTANESADTSPSSDPGKTFCHPIADEGFSNVHVYAAVDLTAKCRPEDDMLRREGVGVPEHYIASVACN